MDLRPEERYFSKEAYIQQIITWKDIQGNTKTNAKRNHNERLYTFQNGLRLKKKKKTLPNAGKDAEKWSLIHCSGDEFGSFLKLSIYHMPQQL